MGDRLPPLPTLLLYSVIIASDRRRTGPRDRSKIDPRNILVRHGSNRVIAAMLLVQLDLKHFRASGLRSGSCPPAVPSERRTPAPDWPGTKTQQARVQEKEREVRQRKLVKGGGAQNFDNARRPPVRFNRE